MLNKTLLRGHTKGPWWACCTDPGEGAHYVFANEAEAVICEPLHNEPGTEGYEALNDTITMDTRRINAKLIAAAPDLLAEHDVLCELVDKYHRMLMRVMEEMALVQNAIITGDKSKLFTDMQDIVELETEITALRGRLSI